LFSDEEDDWVGSLVDGLRELMICDSEVLDEPELVDLVRAFADAEVADPDCLNELLSLRAEHVAAGEAAIAAIAAGAADRGLGAAAAEIISVEPDDEDDLTDDSSPTAAAEDAADAFLPRAQQARDDLARHLDSDQRIVRATGPNEADAERVHRLVADAFGAIEEQIFARVRREVAERARVAAAERAKQKQAQQSSLHNYFSSRSRQ